MKKRNEVLFLSLVSLIAFWVLLIVIKLLTGQETFSEKSSCDLNSGDYRYEKYIYTLKIKDEIEMTDFSKEVRRLGISIPDERIWVFLSGSSVTPFFSGQRADGKLGISGNLRRLMMLLDTNEISDSQRTSIIEEILVCIKEKNMANVDKGFKEILGKYGIDW
jgi:hypothetical protein